MNKNIKIVINIFITLISLCIIFIIGIMIFFSYLEIKPEYKEMGYFERKTIVKEKFTPSKEDLLNNINFYNKIVDYINVVKHFSIIKETNRNYIKKDNKINIISKNKYFITYKDVNIENTGSYIIQSDGYSFDCIKLMNENGILSIGYSSNIFNKGIIFLKDSIKYERGHLFGYLYYTGEKPVIINKNYKINIFDTAIPNRVLFDIQDTLGN